MQLSDNDIIDLTLDLTVDGVVGLEGDNDEEEKSTPLIRKLIQEGLQLCSKLENHFLINDPNSERASKLQRGRVSVEDDEPAGRPRPTITDQNIVKIRDMSGFPLTSVSGDLDEKAKRHHMEKMVREELQRWDSDTSLRVPSSSSNPSPKKKK
ncbi:hypothetical protein TNCV_353941 [Trichonephila clavipes]|uniref:Uncharacterized protein n=1 Tax=Trichonephila clavipes TaxID=2585209 RepID=A0A8X6W191_TRICX|nr:hypothetical protein TNCV_353941 [Trichonephila clavipes]